MYGITKANTNFALVYHIADGPFSKNQDSLVTGSDFAKHSA